MTLGYHVVFLWEIHLPRFSWGWFWLQEAASCGPDGKRALDAAPSPPESGVIWALLWTSESQPVLDSLWTHCPLLSPNGWRVNKSMAYCQITFPLSVTTWFPSASAPGNSEIPRNFSYSTMVSSWMSFGFSFLLLLLLCDSDVTPFPALRNSSEIVFTSIFLCFPLWLWLYFIKHNLLSGISPWFWWEEKLGTSVHFTIFF